MDKVGEDARHFYQKLRFQVTHKGMKLFINWKILFGLGRSTMSSTHHFLLISCPLDLALSYYIPIIWKFRRRGDFLKNGKRLDNRVRLTMQRLQPEDKNFSVLKGI